MKKNFIETEIPFGVKDLELYLSTYTIPDGYSAEIKDSKVIVKKKESEDERIRKNCIHFLELQKAHHADTSEIDDCIAYLEKQKEQKPTNSEKPKEWSEEDIKKIRSEEYTKGFNDAAFGGKLKGWNEEDEDAIEMAVIALEDMYNEDEPLTTYGGHDLPFNVAADRLKSLRPQPHTVSLKDATKFGNLEYERGVKDGIQSEKSHHWKPSEEQMKALKHCVNGWQDTADGILESLYNDLKKLI